MLTLLTLALLPQVAAPAGGQFPATPRKIVRPGNDRPNIVVIVADDFGVDMVGAYAEGSSLPCTPNIDSLATDGLLFRNAWANPTCSPMRAATLSGRYGFRTGVGSPGAGNALDTAEVLIPEILNGYETACMGKWHIGGNNADHPNLSGFDHYAGALGGGVGNYFSWNKVVDGESETSTTYATRDVADDAITMIQTMQEPWFLWVAFNAPHSPFHEPPSEYCGTAQCATTYCGNLPPNPTNAELSRAMIEAMDAEIGRVLTTLDTVDPDAVVFFMGDNGSTRQATQPPFNSMRAKGSPYEGGVNVPLIVRGPGVAQGETQGLVANVDLFSTIAELGGTGALTEDSVSMVPYFSNPSTQVRSFVYSEGFSPNGSGPYSNHDRAVREERYKLIRQIGEPDELYDLWTDPFETTNRIDLGLNSREQAAYDALVAELVRLGVD